MLILQKFQTYKTTQISIDKTKVSALIADSSTKRMIGLMHRKSLDNNQGMLFTFDAEAKHAVWMRNMNFPIDIMWLDKNKNIIDIKTDLKPARFLEFTTYEPKSDAKYAIELPARFIKKNSISTASRVNFN